MLDRLLAQRAKAQPERIFVRFDDGAALGYGAFDLAATRIAAGLQALGLRPGERVATMLFNGPAYLEAWAALCRAGLVEVPLSPALRGDGLANQLLRSQARAIIIDSAVAEIVMALPRPLPDLRFVIVAGEGGETFPSDASWHALEALRLTDTARFRSVATHEADISGIMFTSGTTGPPKGVTQPHSAGLQLARDTVDLMGYGADDVLFTAFPLTHVNAKYATIMAAMMADASAVLHRRFTASGFWNICRREGVTAFNFMGAVLMMLAKQPPDALDRKHKVRMALGALVPPGLHRLFAERFGVELIEVYGSTELGIAASTGGLEVPEGSFGRARPHYEMQVQDDDGQACGPGCAGELVVRPRRRGVMFRDYHEMPEATLAAFRDLWFHTGDRARTDDAGNFYFVDRLSDSIRRRGENISSWEVEQVVGAIEGVAEVAAVGVPSDLSEEEVMVFLVPRSEATLSFPAIIAHCAAHLPAYAVPRFLRTIEALPKNASQRVVKASLRAAGVDAETWDRTKGLEA